MTLDEQIAKLKTSNALLAAFEQRYKMGDFVSRLEMWKTLAVMLLLREEANLKKEIERAQLAGDFKQA